MLEREGGGGVGVEFIWGELRKLFTTFWGKIKEYLI